MDYGIRYKSTGTETERNASLAAERQGFVRTGDEDRLPQILQHTIQYLK